jgi:flagellar biosynthesis GTPase FlhF
MITMARWNIVLLIAALSLTTASPASAQWKWRDKAGRTQYSDVPPPPEVTERDILSRPPGSTSSKSTSAAVTNAASAPASSASAAALKPKNSDPELEAKLEAKRKKAEQDAADAKKADEAKLAAIRAENCKRAKAYMRSIEGGMRIARTNEKGEREILDDTARATETKNTRDVITSDCK